MQRSKAYRNSRKYQMLGDCDAIVIDGKCVGIRKVLGGRQHHNPKVKARLRRAQRKSDRRECVNDPTFGGTRRSWPDVSWGV